MIFRVSNVEAFRYWRQNEDAELEPLLKRLRGEDEPSPAMAAGTAFHKALETAQEGEQRVMHANGYTFNIDCDIELVLPQTRELRLSKSYGPMTVTGCVDILEGKRIEDHKTTARFDPERYIEGYQWRFYLSIFGANFFRWNIFEMDVDRDDSNAYTVFGFHQLEQFRYPALEDDCADLAMDLYNFAYQHMPELRSTA